MTLPKQLFGAKYITCSSETKYIEKVMHAINRYDPNFSFQTVRNFMYCMTVWNLFGGQKVVCWNKRIFNNGSMNICLVSNN